MDEFCDDLASANIWEKITVILSTPTSCINGWLNIYKPKSMSSANAVGQIKKYFYPTKIGHAGTLDLEAEGILPIGLGEATKLMRVLVDAHKKYEFTVQFGASTDTADAAGNIINTTTFIPTAQQCQNICKSFIGNITQMPPAFSALKINGVRAYKLARKNAEVKLAQRDVQIYNLEFIRFNHDKNTATYLVECSKGTYVRTLAEDLALSLQSLGFVIELRRIQVGSFQEGDAINLLDPISKEFLLEKVLRIDAVLDDILALDLSHEDMIRIRHGKSCFFPNAPDSVLVWLRYLGTLCAIGSIDKGCFNSFRVFNLDNGV